MQSVVIIGASHAATETIASLRKQGWTGKICLIGDEPSLPYHRPPLSKTYFSGELDANKLLLRPESFYQSHNVEIRLGQRVAQIDRSAQSVELEDGTQIAYDYLVLATGTRARQLPLDGTDAPNMHTLRTQADVDQIRAQVSSKSKLLIIGAGYIGLEVAASAIKLGADVTVLEAMDRVLERVTSEAVSEFYQNLHRAEGVDLRLQTSVTSFEHHNGISLAHLASGDTIEFDLAIIGIGVIPNSELAAEAGLVCDNGIVVNEFTQTNDDRIFAIGDCSFHHNPFYNRHIRLESVPNAVEQAKVAAAKICGKDIIYDQLPWFWSDQYDVKLQTAGLCQGFDEAVIRGEPADRKFALFYLRDQQLLAVDAINSPVDFMIGKKLIASRLPLAASSLHDTTIPIKTLLGD
ncbi:NAD(P)/FAD-dependent oxidoreductase [Arenicella xantha]|uniref:3-phenylpropionate/trans-cinnamate dioxygenase ferredoxin reductase subunit n=1 Tax=Arenicella xantha TaxID=644221 RepID=A0A395JLL5_9GAMM|nr:FAD-dependent oxidoreductase [Arenicella xantha]RBP51652.1 3-phenylpropionate/trans-cinnamate dioxygenase ferredoxin reductase subunit [Arenicella xantha]